MRIIYCDCASRAPTYPVFREHIHFPHCPLFKRKPRLLTRVSLSEVEEMAFASGYYDRPAKERTEK